METFEYGDLSVLNVCEVTIPPRRQIVTNWRWLDFMGVTKIISASVSITVNA